MNPLWLALHLPHLPLEAHAPVLSPSAVVEHGSIVACDAAARQAGIENGIGTAAARALVPAMTLIARNPAREAAALQTLACWAGSLTPRVSLASGGLLLEIGGSLRLFGGLDKLAAIAKAGLRGQGFTVALAAAPTPLGALWLARAGTGALCADTGQMRRHLDALPLSVLPDDASVALARFGARTLADVRGLPPAALARSIGMESLQSVSRAFGELPDPRADFVFPDRFSLSLELPAPVEAAAGLLFAARRLTAALSGWLAARQAAVNEFALRLRQRKEETVLVLQFTEATADGARFERVLRERIERLALAAPVEALVLEAERIAPRPARNRALFHDAIAEREAVGALLERLRARLGDGQVYRIAPHEDHRPECASRRAALFEQAGADTAQTPPRPLWLLDAPQALAEVDGRPYLRGHLQLLAGPERIESGWWDGGEAVGDLRRDYFIALSADAGWLWIYRECRAPGGWFLQGVFA